MSIKVNDKVRVVSSMGYLSQVMGETGTIIQVYDFMVPMAVVKFENGITAKVEVSNLIKVEAQENQAVKPEAPEIPEGAKKVTVGEFMKAIQNVSKPDKIIEKVGAEKGMLVGMAVLVSGIKLAERLFKDTEVIVITKDQMIHEIVASVADEDPKFMMVALINGMILRGIVDEIFGGNSENA